MMSSEKLITLTAKLYEARATMRNFWGDRYQEKIDEVRPYILKAMLRTNGEVIPATMAIIRQLQDAGASGMMQAQILATCVDMVESSASNDEKT